jgi:hypothetical protein
MINNDKYVFFGCLADENLNTLKEDKRIQLFILKELFIEMNRISLNESSFGSKEKIRVPIRVFETPSEKVKNEFYKFILQQIKNNIETDFLLFFREFNREIYGLEFSEQKKLGLRVFKEIYKQIELKEIALLNNIKSSNGIDQVHTMKVLKTLKWQREANKITISKIEFLTPYFSGDSNYFEGSDFLENEHLINITNFEKLLKVLISLNDRFEFEQDTTFSALGILKDNYANYRNTFINFDVFSFTHQQIKNYTSNIPSQIESLYAALVSLDLIIESKIKFLEYVNKEHQKNISKIRNYSGKDNRKHDFRVAKLKEELRKLPLNS